MTNLMAFDIINYLYHAGMHPVPKYQFQSERYNNNIIVKIVVKAFEHRYIVIMNTEWISFTLRFSSFPIKLCLHYHNH